MDKTRFAIYTRVLTPQARQNIGQTIQNFVQKLKQSASQWNAEVLEQCSHVTGGKYDAVVYVAVPEPNAILPMVFQANQEGHLLTETEIAFPISQLSQLSTWSKTGATAERTR